MKNAVEIYKLLPKTNCGTCGMPTCFGFATKVASRMASITACVNLKEAVREEIAKDIEADKCSGGTIFEKTLEALKPKIAALDFVQVAKDFGADLSGNDRMALSFLNESYTVTRDRIIGFAGTTPTAFISILIYNHLSMPSPPPVSGEWITFSSIPASHAKDKAWAGHVEDIVARHFTGNIKGLKKACVRMGGKKSKIKGSHDIAYEFRFFPRYPALLQVYDAVPSEDFPAQCKLLLDKTVDKYLDIESIVVLGEEFASRLTGEKDH